MTTEERARALWGSLPIIQEDYIPVIQEALEKQKAIDIDKAKRAFCSVCGCKKCTERNVTCDDYKEFVKYIEK